MVREGMSGMARRWLLAALGLLGAAVSVAYVLWPQPPLHPTGYTYVVQGGFAGFDLTLEVDAAGSWTYRDGKDPYRQSSGRLTSEQAATLTRLAQEVDWPHLPERLASQPQPADELFRTVEVRAANRRYRVTVGSVAPIPEPLTNLLNFLEGVRRDAEATLPPRFSLVTEGPALYLTGGTGQKIKLLELAQLPATFRPQGGQSDFGVGKDGFGPCALSPGGTRVAWTTAGLHPLAGYLNLQDRRPVPLDLYFEGGVQALSWAPGDGYLVVQVLSPAGGTVLAAYAVPRGNRIAFPATQQFPPSAYRLSVAGWKDDHTLLFRVETLPGNPPPGIDQWWWDLKAGKVAASPR